MINFKSKNINYWQLINLLSKSVPKKQEQLIFADFFT
jgi:hypothetical protein